MNLERFIERLAKNAEAIEAMTRGLSDEDARFKPEASSWSILEVINHLDDEEREDFRVRLEFILHRPGEKWPPINPQGWVTERRYNERSLPPSMESFLAERGRSLVWLRRLGQPDWKTEGVAPFGSITAGDMFAAWVAHDLLHLRQLVKLRWALTTRSLEPYSTRYAGEW